MGSFDFDKFTKHLRSIIDDELVDEIEEKWNVADRSGMEEKSKELRDKYASKMNANTISELQNLHKKVKKRRKGIARKLKESSSLGNSLLKKVSPITEDKEIEPYSCERDHAIENDSAQNPGSTTLSVDTKLGEKEGNSTEGNILEDTAQVENELLDKKTDNKIRELKEMQSKKTELTRFKEELVNKNEEVDKLERRIQCLEKTLIKQSADLEKTKNIDEERENDIQALQTRIQKLEEVAKDLNTDIEKRDKSIKENDLEIETLKAQLIQQTDLVTEKKSKFEKSMATINELRKQNIGFTTRIKDLEDTVKQKVTQLDTTQMTIKEKDLEIETLKTRLDQQTELVNRKELQLDRSKTSIDEFRRENKDLATRLSAVAGTKLLHNNPNIADLSDQDRPTKLADRYSELYDNEWTEAFTVLYKDGFGEDRKIIKILLEIVQDCYTECIIQASEQLRHVKSILVCPTCAMKPETKQALDKYDMYKLGSARSSLSFSLSRLKEQRNSALLASLSSFPNFGYQDQTSRTKVEDYTFTDLQEKSITDLVKQTANASYKSLLETILQRHSSVTEKKKVKDYVHCCTELCWKMAVQTPPLYINCYDWEGCKFRKTEFKEYTQTGDMIKYIVWPPLYLYESGPLLCKGTAQSGKKKKGKKEKSQ